MKTENINWNLIAKYLAGECTDDERLSVQKWMEAHPDNAQQLKSAQDIWSQSSKDDLPKVPSEKMWKAIKQKTQSPSRTINLSWLRYAAIFIIIFGGALIFYVANKKASQNIEWIVVNSSADTIRTVQLPDGSTVWLNKNSSISYPSVFAEDLRQAKLDGEAYFEITHNPLQHFKIFTGKTVVEVLGTSFNIQYNKATGDVTLMVTTGKVIFANADSVQQQILVTAGETAQYMATETPALNKINKNDENQIAWKTGKFIFKDMSLDSVVNILNQQFKTSIIFKSESLKNLQISVEFENNTLDEMLQVIALTLKISILEENQQYIISAIEPTNK